MPEPTEIDLIDRQREKIQRAIVDLMALRDSLPPEKQLDADRIVASLEAALGEDFRLMNSEG